MRDRIPTPGKENRVKITQDDGQIVEGVLSYADDATQDGSVYNKANVLPDDVCGILGLDSNTAEPKDAWIGVMHALGYSILIITALEVDGSPLANFQVSGLPDTLIESKTYTDDNGKLSVIIPEGTYTLSIPDANCIDATVPSKSVVVSAGETQNITMQQTKVQPAKKTITSSQTVRFSSNVASVDVFCCGGGGGGGGGDGRGGRNSGGGGGGGYTTTALGKTVTPYASYTATVGSGGSGGSGALDGITTGTPDDGFRGGSTSFLGVNASGGDGGGDNAGSSTRRGGDGGSGGGSGAGGYYSGSDGGTDGSDGEETTRAQNPGTGQGSTTRAFGESAGTLCAGGGGGGYGGEDGAGTYGQGGTGGNNSGSDGHNGRAGVIMIRWVNKT